jgi:hypothetical protein
MTEKRIVFAMVGKRDAAVRAAHYLLAGGAL